MKKILYCFLLLLLNFSGKTQTNLVLDPGTRYQTIDGWGVSLAWWANVAGGWSDDKIDTLCTWLTSPTGLNMNVFRFNIAGQENPAHNHFRYSANLQGYKVSETSSFDFTRDSTQRKILLKLKSKRSDCVFEAISYSPPYWMTNSGCTAGNTGGTDNLKTGYFTAYADYLTDVVKYYHDSLGITFKTLEPVNEPSSTWWVVNGTQAGCYYSTTNLINVINEVYNKLQAKSMLSYCTISSMDASNGRESLTELNAIVSNNIISKISQVNTHSYSKIDSTLQYQQLYDSATKYGKKVWQSESGPLDLGSVSGDGFANNLYMTDALIRDMRNLKPNVWCDWQYGDLGNTWSHIQYDSNATFAKIPNFYTRMQLSRFIKSGHTIINSSETNSLAAINSTNDTIALVINNSSLSDKSYSINLNLFASTGGTAQIYRTSTGMDGAHWYGSNYKVYTYQTIAGLPNGTYTAKAWVKSGGGQSQCYFEAKNFGGTALTTNIPRSIAWTQITISNINVTNGQCVIGFYSNASKNNWCEFDDVELRLNSAPSTNYVANSNFESSNVYSQSIPSWSSSDTTAADFIQSESYSNNEECVPLSNISVSNNILSFTANKKSISTLLIPVTIASTAPIANGNYRITAKHSNKEMSVSGASLTDGAIIEQWDSVATATNEIFNIQLTPTGYKLLPSYNAKVVTIDGYSQSNGGVVNQWTDYEQLNQRFSIIDIGGGYYKIVARHSGKCLAVTGNGMNNGDDIVQWDWLNYDNFKWRFTPVSLSSPIANGTYTIKAKHSGKVMSVAGWSTNNGGIIEQWSNLCQDNEKFSVQFTSSGYKIRPIYNNKLVSINNYSVANGASVVQWDSLNQSHQFYEISDLGSGFYKIISRYSNKCLAVTNSDTTNGADVVQWEWLNYDNFKWSFETPCQSLSKRPSPQISIINDLPESSLMIYPNPTSGLIQLNYSNIENASIELLDLSGKLLLKQKASGRMVIDLKKYVAAGVYVVKIIGVNKSVIKKIVVQ